MQFWRYGVASTVWGCRAGSQHVRARHLYFERRGPRSFVATFYLLFYDFKVNHLDVNHLLYYRCDPFRRNSLYLLDPQRRHKLRVFFWDGARRGQIPDSEQNPVRRIRDGFPEGPLFGNSHFTAGGGGFFRNRSSMSIVHPSYRVSHIP